MGIGVLGPLQVDGHGLSPRDRVVLSALVVRAGEPVSAETLADALWGDEPPTSWAKVLQGCVVRLRKLLGSGAIVSSNHGYRLVLTDEELDYRLFERLLDRAREALAGGDPARSSYLAHEGLELWRGAPLQDLEEWEPGRVETVRLEGLRMDAEELVVEAEIGAGRARDVLDQARALVTQAPFRERRWALLARALHLSGRQPEALGAIKRARAMLAEEFGLDPGRELVELESMLLRQDPSLSPATHREVSVACPYRGLLPYETSDADSFFGRTDDIAACLRRLRDTGVLTVTGPSGVGKSSLVRAGVVATLSSSGTAVHLTTPGAHPMDSLAGLKPRGRQTLVVDQAEEAVTLCADPAERARYFAALAQHVGSGGRLVLALRADHLGDLAPYPEIARILEDGMYLLGPLSEPGLRSAIEGPARRAGLRLEPGLVDLLIREVQGEPAALPLLSHVLRETWGRREGPTLTVAGYRATGGIQQAVSQSAESVYDAMDATQRSQLRGLLLRLVMPTEDGDPVRARVPHSKVAVDAAHERLVEQLVEARLVSIDGDTVQIAHEALVRVWPRLRGWLDDDVDGQRLFRHLSGAVDSWESMGRPDSELYRGPRLSRTLEWRDRATPDLSAAEAAFLDASAALSESELAQARSRLVQQRRTNRRLRASLTGVGLFLVLALLAGLVAVQSAGQARRDRDRAEQAANLADARRAGALAPGHDVIATSLLLGVAALRVDDSPEEWENLATTLTRAGSLTRIQDIGDAFPVSVAAGGDGALVAMGTPLDGVHLFDAATLRPIEFGDDTPASSVVFSPDGSLMAAAVNQWTGGAVPRIVAQPLHVYDMPSGEPASRQPGGWPKGANIEYSLGFSGDGRRIAAGVLLYRGVGVPSGAVVMVWDVAHPSQPVFTVAVPDPPRAALSPDGSIVYTVSPGNRSVRAYDVDSGRLLRWAGVDRFRYSGLGGALTVSPDGATLAAASGDRILRFDTATLQPRGAPLVGHAAEVNRVEYSHEGTMLLSASTDGSTIIWDAESGAQLRRFAAHNAGIWGAAFGADDHTVYSAAGDGTLMSWDVTGRRDLLSVGRAGDTAGGLGVSVAAPNGRTVARIRDNHLWFADYRSGRTTVKHALPDPVWSSAWSPDASRFLTTGPGMLSVWDAKTARLVTKHRYRPGLDVLAAFGSDSDLVYVDDRDGDLDALDPSTLRPALEPMPFDGVASALLPRPGGREVLVLKADGSFDQIDPVDGATKTAQSLLPPAEHQLAAFSGDGSLLAAPSESGSLGLLDPDTSLWIGDPSATEWGFNVVFAPDGSQFASVLPDRIRLWDGHTGAYQASVPLPDLPASGEYSKTTRGPGATMAYLPDSSGLLVASADGRTWTVDTRKSAWVDRACRIAGRNLTRAEWEEFFPTRPYAVTCRRWPPGS